MFITEEEAKKKCCPMSFNRPVADPARDTGGMHTFDPPWWCKGSDCMAWRWAAMNSEGMVVICGTKDAAEKFMGRSDQWTAGGYCGLAGTPRS